MVLVDRLCSDDEMKAWLSGFPSICGCLILSNHLTANPRFINGAVDPYTNRSGLFEAGNGVSTVPVPSNLANRTAVSHAASRQRSMGKQDCKTPLTLSVIQIQVWQ